MAIPNQFMAFGLKRLKLPGLCGWIALVAPCIAMADGFPNRVAAGDVTANSAVLWAHATNLGPLTFTLSIPSSPGTVEKELRVDVSDAAVPVKVPATDLSPDTTYSYRVQDAQGNVETGQFHTPAAPGLFRGLRFGVSGDWRGDLAPYPSVSNAAKRQLDFFVSLGDTIYADYPSPAFTNVQATTLADYRAKHNEVYSERFNLNALGDLRASTALFAVWDDHEVTDDFAGGAPPQSDPRFDPNGAFINETTLFRNGLQAFNEFNPILPQVYETPGALRTHLKPKFYRYQTYGNDAALFLLDTRSFRDTELPSVHNPLDQGEVKAFNFRSFDLDPATGQPLPRRTMLGAQQLADLKQDLLRAEAGGALWKVIIAGEPVQALGFADGSDRFEGYASERTELLKFLTDHQIRNVLFIAADIHANVVNNVSYQLGPDQPQIPTGAFEVVTGPVAFDKPLGPTAFDFAAGIQVLPGLTLLDGLLNFAGVTNRAAFDALPLPERDRLFKSIMDVQLDAIKLDTTGLEGSDIKAILISGGYVAAHSYGWTEFEIDPLTHDLTVTAYGIPAYAPSEVTPQLASRQPEVLSQFKVSPFTSGQTLGAIQVAQTGHKLQLSWPASPASQVLQTRASLGSGTWLDATNPPVITPAGATVEISTDGPAQFFRLRSR